MLMLLQRAVSSMHICRSPVCRASCLESKSPDSRAFCADHAVHFLQKVSCFAESRIERLSQLFDFPSYLPVHFNIWKPLKFEDIL